MPQLAFTKNKQAIRKLWDKPIISQFSRKIERKLSYFGLPGPDVQDLIEWKQFIGWTTAVEFQEVGRSSRVQKQQRIINRLQANAMLNGLNARWEIRKGRLEEIVLEGIDIDGNKPALFHRSPRPHMQYELHNWDFQGGLGYRNKQNEARRIDAIKRCIELQKDHPFLFLLTLNVRHDLGEEPSKYLHGQANELMAPEYKEKLGWYAAQGTVTNTDRYRTKAIVPLIIRQAAHLNSFDCHCYPVIYYTGPKEHLLHFVFSLWPSGTMLPAFSTQKITEVIELPLIVVNEGRFTFAQEQFPGFKKDIALRQLAQYELPESLVIADWV